MLFHWASSFACSHSKG